jgi:hypothetical protein
MSDSHRRYRSIRDAIGQMYASELKGHAAGKLNTLAALISGIVGSQRTNYPQIASKVSDQSKPESRVKRFSRWVNEGEPEAKVQILPFVQELLTGLSSSSLVLIMDGSEVGRKCLTLMLSVVYQGRALPLAWIVVRGSKGHFPDSTHIALLEAILPLIPEQSDVIFLGDGEFDGVEFQAVVQSYHWSYVCRTSINIILGVEGEEVSFKDLMLSPGECRCLPEVRFTRQGFGPLQALAWWRTGFKQPIFLVTNLELPEEACHWYQKRFRIETFFSDQKSRGFHLHKSHLSLPHRLARLMIAACLAYIWIVYLGQQALQGGWNKIIHRTERCDLSLFQLGLRFLDYLIDHDEPIPVSLTLLV